MTDGEILIDVKGVAKHFGEGETRVDALRDVDLQVRAGEVIALLGPSGSGKMLIPTHVAPLFRNDLAPLFRELVAP